MNAVILYAAIIVILIICSAFFSLTETAFTSVNRVRLKKMANEGDKKAEKTLSMLENYDKFLTTNLIGVNIVNVASTSVASLMFIGIFSTNEGLASIVNIVVMTLVSLTFCEVIPKSVAKKNPEKWCLKTCGIFGVLMKLFSPVSWLFTKLTAAIGKDDSTGMTEDELEVMVDECAGDGVLEQSESDLIKSAIRFDDIQVSEVYVPRMDIVAIDVSADPKELGEKFTVSGYSRIPVYDKSIDNIIGVAYSKEFFTNEYLGVKFSIRDIVKPVKYVPDTMSIANILNDFQKSKMHMAVVLDSYGGTMGIVTMEDLLEELVGDIWDESDEIQQDVVKVNEDTYIVEGTANIYDIMEGFGRKFDPEDYDDYSVTGYICYKLGRPPNRGDKVETEDVEITVRSVKGRRVMESVFVLKRRPQDEVSEE